MELTTRLGAAAGSGGAAGLNSRWSEQLFHGAVWDDENKAFHGGTSKDFGKGDKHENSWTPTFLR